MICQCGVEMFKIVENRLQKHFQKCDKIAVQKGVEDYRNRSGRKYFQGVGSFKS